MTPTADSQGHRRYQMKADLKCAHFPGQFARTCNVCKLEGEVKELREALRAIVAAAESPDWEVEVGRAIDEANNLLARHHD